METWLLIIVIVVACLVVAVAVSWRDRRRTKGWDHPDSGRHVRQTGEGSAAAGAADMNRSTGPGGL